MKVSNSVDNRNLERLEGSKSRKTDAPKTKSADLTSSGATSVENANVKSDISGRARDMASAKEAALRAPEVREDRVSELKRKIQNREYSVSPEAIADKLLKEHLETGKMG